MSASRCADKLQLLRQKKKKKRKITNLPETRPRRARARAHSSRIILGTRLTYDPIRGSDVDNKGN